MDRELRERRRRSIRLRGYDYSEEGAYFVTICTWDRQPLLGRIVEGRMIPSECGWVVAQSWLDIPGHFPDVGLDEWVVMPNHLHGILVISHDRRGTACRAPTPASERFGKPTTGSLPTIVRSFKAAATRRINVLRGSGGRSVWQRGYYEHVIRNEAELDRLRRYVLDNPVQWDTDEDNPGRAASAGPQGERCRQAR